MSIQEKTDHFFSQHDRTIFSIKSCPVFLWAVPIDSPGQSTIRDRDQKGHNLLAFPPAKGIMCTPGDCFHYCQYFRHKMNLGTELNLVLKQQFSNVTQCTEIYYTSVFVVLKRIRFLFVMFDMPAYNMQDWCCYSLTGGKESLRKFKSTGTSNVIIKCEYRCI